MSAAAAELNSERGGEWPPFEAVWAGYAGCGRVSDRELLYPDLAPLFPHASLRLTGDGDLLCAPMEGLGASLICGTGALAQLWCVPPHGEPVRLLRSGGWGPVLDDRGSAWSLGKAAVCSVLFYAANEMPLLSWQEQLLRRLGTDAEELIRTTSALDTGLSHADADSKRKTTIAGFSDLVVAAAEQGDQEAARILRRIAGEVCEILEPVRAKLDTVLEQEAQEMDDEGRQRDGGERKEATLVVAGSLGLNATFWSFVEEQFRARGWVWSRIAVADPARVGLEHLLRNASTSGRSVKERVSGPPPRLTSSVQQL